MITLRGDTPASSVTISIPPSWGITARNAQAKMSTRLARRLGAILYLPPISLAMGQVTMMPMVLFTIAAESRPDIRPMPYSACLRFLIRAVIAPTSHSAPP